MTKDVAHQATKAFYWSQWTVGAADTFFQTWIWLPFRAKEALIQAVDAGLFTILVPWGGRLDWPHWTDAGLDSLSKLTGLSKRELYDNKSLDAFIMKPELENKKCTDSEYMRDWDAMAADPESIVDRCLRALLEDAYEGDFDVISTIRGLLPAELNARLDAIVEAMYYHASRGATGKASSEPADDMFRTLQKAEMILQETSKDSPRFQFDIEFFTEHQLPEFLTWARTGTLSRENRSVPEEETGFGSLAGRSLTRPELDELLRAMDDHRWQTVRNRLAELHEEGNTTFEAMDAILLARKVCAGEFPI